MNRGTSVKRWIINAFIVCILNLFFIDAIPAVHLLHERAQARIDPFLDKTGLWQSRWNLFAPEPDTVNTYLGAEITYADGSFSRWRSPNWRQLTPGERFRRFREMEYYDSVRMDSNRSAWPGLAQSILKKASSDNSNKRPVKIVLTRYWWDIPDMKEEFVAQADINKNMRSFEFYTKEFIEDEY